VPRLAAALLVPLLILSGGAGGLYWLGQFGAGPPTPHFVEALSGEGPVALAVLGNSVARASVDAEALGEALALPGRSVSLATQGSQPAHWLAALTHRLFPAGHRPAAVVIYAPLQVLLHGELVAERDRALLIDLLTRPDPALVEAALGGADPGDAFGRGRQRARAALLRSVGRAPARLIWGRAAADDWAEGLSVTPNDPDARFRTVPGAPTPGEGRQLEPAAAPLEESFLPAISAACRAQGARLVVVDPAVRPAERGGGCRVGDDERRLRAWLEASGADFLDIGRADIDPEPFTTRYHTLPAGRAQVSAALAAGLAALESQARPAGGPGRVWETGCGG